MALEPKRQKKKVKKRYKDRERAGWKKERRRRVEKKKNPKVIWPKCTYRPKHTEIHRNGRNTPKHLEILLEVEWGVSRTSLHTNMRFSVCSDRNGTEYTTMSLMARL